MYQSCNLTESVAIINRLLTDAEMQRHHREHQLTSREIDRHGPLAAVRRVAARWLVALGTRLDATVGMPVAAGSGPRA